jgi:hypothetical protein
LGVGVNDDNKSSSSMEAGSQDLERSRSALLLLPSKATDGANADDQKGWIHIHTRSRKQRLLTEKPFFITLFFKQFRSSKTARFFLLLFVVLCSTSLLAPSQSWSTRRRRRTTKHLCECDVVGRETRIVKGEA